MFSKSDGVEDRLNDQVGSLVQELSSRSSWNAEANRARDRLVALLESKGFISFHANVTNYGRWSTGESMLLYVSQDRRGALEVFRGQVIRLVCVRSGRYTRLLMAGPISASKKLRANLLDRQSKNQHDILAKKRASEPYLNGYLRALGIRGNNRADGFTFLAAREDSSMSSTWTRILALEHVEGLNFRLHLGQLEILGSVYELLDSDSMYDEAGDIVVPGRFNGVKVIGLEDGEYLQINKFVSEDASEQFNSMEMPKWHKFLQDNDWIGGKDSSGINSRLKTAFTKHATL